MPVSSDQIGATTVWKYNDNGVDLGTTWTAPSFADSTWKTGRGVLGTANASSCAAPCLCSDC